MEIDIYDAAGELPHFNEDLEGDPVPSSVAELRRRIQNADGLLFATPEYNGSVPGSLKNLIDWASRPYGESPLTGKTSAVVGASVSKFGALRAQDHLLDVLRATGAVTVGDAHPIGPATDVFSSSGVVKEQGVLSTLREVLEELAAASGASRLVDRVA